MALSVKHSKVSAIPDGADSSLVLPSDWNAAHTFAGATSGGVAYFTGSTAMDSSDVLSGSALVLGGGAGAPPSTPVGLGTSTQVLHGNAAGAPSWGAVSLTADIQGGTASRVVLAGGAGASPTMLAAGTTTQVLHGNAGGSPTWSALDLANDVTGTLGVANGGNITTHPGYVANNWYLPTPYSGALAAGGAVGNGTIRFIPFIPPQTMTISTLGIRTATAGSTNVQLAIYASQTTAGAGKRPTGSALSTTASIVNTGANTSINAALGANVQVTAGTTYFLALNCNDGTMTAQATSASSMLLAVLLGSATQGTAVGTAVAITHLSFASAFNSWPDMTSNSCTEVTSNAYGLIQFKVASIP